MNIFLMNLTLDEKLVERIKKGMTFEEMARFAAEDLWEYMMEHDLYSYQELKNRMIWTERDTKESIFESVAMLYEVNGWIAEDGGKYVSNERNDMEYKAFRKLVLQALRDIRKERKATVVTAT